MAATKIKIKQLTDGTAGQLITWDASGVPATVATGTSGQILTSNGVGAAPTFQTAASGPTASNGLTLSSGDIKLGGALTQVTTLTGDATNYITVTGSRTGGSTPSLLVNNTSSTGAALKTLASGFGTGVWGESTYGTGVYGSGSIAVGGFSTGTLGTLFQMETAATNSVLTVMALDSLTTGVATDGIGSEIQLRNETSTTPSVSANSIVSQWVTADHNTRLSQLSFTGQNVGVKNTLFSLLGTGKATLNKYGGGTFTGTAAYNLQVDSSGNIIETTAGGGGGSGDIINGGNTTGANISIGTNDAFDLNLETNNVTKLSLSSAGTATFTPTITATGALKGIVYTGVVNTNQTLSTEIPSITLTTAGREWATGAIATQREVLITQPTYSFVGASTITNAATLGIAGAPIKSTNATITNTHGILVQAGAVSTATNSYGLSVNTQTGATTNYAAQFLGGNVGIGTSTPTVRLDVNNTTATTNAVQTQLNLATSLTTGIVAAGFGTGILLQGTANNGGTPSVLRDMAKISSTWTTATDGSRQSQIVFQVLNGLQVMTDFYTFAYGTSTAGLFSIGAANPVGISAASIAPTQAFTIGNSSSSDISLVGGRSTANCLKLYLSDNSGTSAASINIGSSGNAAQTSGTRNYINFDAGFAPPSGTAVHNQFSFTGTLSQTGGTPATGIIRCINIAHTMGAVADYRAIEIADNIANTKGIYQTGALTTNNFVGKTAFGSTTTPSEAINVTGNIIVAGQYAATKFALTDGATIPLDWNSSNVQSVTLAGNRIFTFASPKAGARYLILLKQDTTGSRTVTWPTIIWRGGTAPTLTTAPNKTDLITLVYDGTSYYGDASLNY